MLEITPKVQVTEYVDTFLEKVFKTPLKAACKQDGVATNLSAAMTEAKRIAARFDDVAQDGLWDFVLMKDDETEEDDQTQAQVHETTAVAVQWKDISEAEKQRRWDQKLCMACGEPGHRARFCQNKPVG